MKMISIIQSHLKKTITILLCITSIFLISACAQVEQNKLLDSKTILKEENPSNYQKETTPPNSISKIDNSQENNLNTDSISLKQAPKKLLSMFESGNYILPDAKCSLSCLKKLLFFKDENYATDGKNIYINVFDGGSSWVANYQVMKDIDINSFQLLIDDLMGYTYYFKDKNKVYFNTFSTYKDLSTNIKILKNIDSKTVKLISTHCLTDKNSVYCDMPYMYSHKEIEMKKVEGADPESFIMDKKAEHETIFMDNNNHFKNIATKGIDIQIVE